MSVSYRFCLVTTFYPPFHFGGDGIFVHRLARALAGQGHQVDVVHSVDAYHLSRAKPHAGFEEIPGVRRLELASRLPRINSLASHQFGAPIVHRRRLEEILAPGRYDVIHFHNISLVGGPAVLSYGDAIKLYTTHEYWLVCPTHVLFAFNRQACVEKRCLSCTVQSRRPPQLWRYTDLMRHSVGHLDRLLLPSRFALERHRADGIDAPMQVLPNFVPVPDLDPLPPAGEPYFLFVGRLEKLKGLQDLLPMLRDFPQARLLIAGTGKYETDLKEQAQGMPNVEFLGQVHPSRVAELYRDALAVLVPSLCYEVFPLAPVEAMANGVPVIARRIGALTEVIEESGGGLLWDTAPQCREAMQSLLNSPDLRGELGRRGRRTAKQKWTEQAHLGQYLELIAQLTGDKRRTTRQSAGSHPIGRD